MSGFTGIGGESAADLARRAEEALRHQAQSVKARPVVPLEAKRVQQAFTAFTKEAGLRASTAAISHVYPEDFSAALDRLQERLGAETPAHSPRAALHPAMSPADVEAARRRAAVNYRPGVAAQSEEVEELRKAASALAHAYATNSPLLPSVHADFLATADRIKDAVLSRALGTADREA